MAESGVAMKCRNVVGAFIFWMIVWSAAAQPLSDQQSTNRSALRLAQAKPPNCERSGSPAFHVCCKTGKDSKGAGCDRNHQDCNDLRGQDELDGFAGCDHIVAIPPAHQFNYDKFKKTLQGELQKRPDLGNYKTSCIEHAIDMYNSSIAFDQAQANKEPKDRPHPYLMTDESEMREIGDATKVYDGMIGSIPKTASCKK
jgi:hypothetical protein